MAEVGAAAATAASVAEGSQSDRTMRRPPVSLLAAAADGLGRKAVVSPGYGKPVSAHAMRLNRYQRQLVCQRARRRVAQLAAPAVSQENGAQQREQQPESERPPDEPRASGASMGSCATGLARGNGEAEGLPVVLEGPRGERYALILGARDGLASVLSEAGSVGVPPHDAVVWLQQPQGRPVQLAFVGRATLQLLVVGASPLRSAASLETGTTLYVRSRVDNASSSSAAHTLDNEQAAEPPPRPECRICAMGDDDDSGATGDRLIAPCACKGTVKFVHVSCLQEWRRRNMAQARFCSICSDPYNCIRDASTWDYLSHYCGKLLRSPLSSAGAVCFTFIQHAFVNRCSVHLPCLLTRITSALVLLLACAVVGRLFVSVASEFVHSMLVMDEVLDRVFLPPRLVEMMNAAFPPMPYVLSSAPAAPTGTDEMIASAQTRSQLLLPEVPSMRVGAGIMATASAVIDFCAQFILLFWVAFMEVHNQWLQWSLLSLAMGWEDVIVGVLAWSVVLSCARRAGDSTSVPGLWLRALRPWLQSPITLLSDMANLVHVLFPSFMAVVHGLALLLPTCIYLVRRGLHIFGVVDVDESQYIIDFRTGDNIGLHVLMAVVAITFVANGFGVLHFVCRHHHEWRVSNSFID